MVPEFVNEVLPPVLETEIQKAGWSDMRECVGRTRILRLPDHHTHFWNGVFLSSVVRSGLLLKSSASGFYTAHTFELESPVRQRLTGQRGQDRCLGDPASALNRDF
jgi:hypothetical protein